MKRRVHLVLIPENGMTGLADFHHIAGLIRQRCGDVLPHVIKARHAPLLQARFWNLPTLYVGFYEARRFTPWRGLCLRGQRLSKSEELARMRAAGTPVPEYMTYDHALDLDPGYWGECVVVKPDPGREGNGVLLVPTRSLHRSVAGMDAEGGLLVQRYVATGVHPCYQRVLTLFGEPLYCRRTVNRGVDMAEDGWPPRTAPADDRPGHDIVANAAHGTHSLCADDELLAFARDNARRAFPEIPLLGQDIVRDMHDGRLYCLEVNAYGSTWHFSSPSGRRVQQASGIDYAGQFGAFAKAADVLIAKAREAAC